MKTSSDIIVERGGGFEIEGIAYSPDGILLHVKGHKVPFKGMPNQKAIDAIDCVKLLLKSLHWKVFFVWNAFEATSYKILFPHFMSLENMTNTARELELLLGSVVGDRVARVISHIIEYDGAYRFRLMDLANETSQRALLVNLRGEIKRLLAINKKRDYEQVNSKIERVGKLVLFVLLWPPLRRKVLDAIRESDFQELQFDPIDAYWAFLKTDYDYFGHKSG